MGDRLLREERLRRRPLDLDTLLDLLRLTRRRPLSALRLLDLRSGGFRSRLRLRDDLREVRFSLLADLFLSGLDFGLALRLLAGAFLLLSSTDTLRFLAFATGFSFSPDFLSLLRLGLGDLDFGLAAFFVR